MSSYNLPLNIALQVPSATISGARQQISSGLQNINIGVNAQGIAQANSTVQNLNRNLQRGTKNAQTFTAALAIRAQDAATYTLLSGAIYRITGAIAGATRESIRYQAELSKIAQTLDVSNESIYEQSQALRDVSIQYNVSLTKAASLTRILAQTGLSFKEAVKGAELLARTSLLASFDNLTDTTEGFIAVMSTFNITVKESAQVLESINVLSKKYAVESSDLVEAISRTGGAFQAAGGQVNELLALITSVRSTTRESVETIATGFRTIFGRLQRPATIKYFQDLGIALTDLEGNFIGPFDAIEAISEGLDRLGIKAGSIEFAKAVEQIGGIRQISRVIPLLQEAAKSREALNQANNAGASTEADLAKAQQTIAFQLGQLQKNFQSFISEVLESDSFQVFAKTLITIANGLIEVGRAVKPLIPLLTALTAIKFVGGLASGKGVGGAIKGALGFARGGIVPGSGNGDTVPAMLTPGEFVIRKSAVQAFGADRLSKINKYASGGKVSKNVNPVASTLKQASPLIDNYYDSGSKVVESSGKKIKPNDKISVNINYVGEGQEADYDTFRKTAFNNFQKIAKEIAAKNIEVGDKGREFIDAINNLKYENEPISNFRSGVETSSSIFGGGKNFNDFIKNSNIINGSFNEGDRKFLNKTTGAMAEIYVQKKLSNAEKLGNAYGADFKISDKHFAEVKTLKQKSSTKDSPNKLASKAALAYGKDRKFNNKLTDIVPSQSGSLTLDYYNFYQKFAKGGPVGTDTVPALLTPGEFVVNKKSAQSFGYGNLKKINRYADGGVVGSQAQTTSGMPRLDVGDVKLNTSTSGLDKLNKAAADTANTLGSKTVKAGDVLSSAFLLMPGVLQQFTGEVNENSSAFTRVTSTILEFSQQVAVAGLALQTFGIGTGNLFKLLKGGFTGKLDADIIKSIRVPIRQFGELIKSKTPFESIGKGLSSSAGKIAKSFTSIASTATLAATAGTAIYGFGKVVDEISGVIRDRDKAIKEGNIQEAGRTAAAAQTQEDLNKFGAGVTVALSAFGPVGTLFGAAFAGILKVAAQFSDDFASFGTAIRDSLSNIGLADSSALIEQRARSEAAAINTQKINEKTQREATNALQKFTQGTISATEFLNEMSARERVDATVKEIGENRKTASQIQKEIAKNSNANELLGSLKQVLSLGFADTIEERANALSEELDNVRSKTKEAALARLDEIQPAVTQKNAELLGEIAKQTGKKIQDIQWDELQQYVKQTADVTDDNIIGLINEAGIRKESLDAAKALLIQQELEKKAREDSLRLFKLQQTIFLDNYRKQYQLTKSLNDLIKASDNLNKSFDFMSRLSDITGTVQIAGGAENQLSDISNITDPNALNDVFASLKNVSPEINKAIQEAKTAISNIETIKAPGGTAEQIFGLITEDLQKQFSESKETVNLDAITKDFSQIVGQFTNDPIVLNSLSLGFQDLLKSTQGRVTPQAIIELLSPITQGGEEAAKALQEASKRQIDGLNKFAQGLRQINTVINKITDEQLAAFESSREFNNAVQELVTGRGFDPSQNRQLDVARQGVILGQDARLAGNTAAIGLELKKLQDEIAAADQRIEQNVSATAEERKADIKLQEERKQRTDRLNKALDEQIKSFSTLKMESLKLAQIERDLVKQRKEELLGNIGKTLKEQIERAQTQVATSRILSGNLPIQSLTSAFAVGMPEDFARQQQAVIAQLKAVASDEKDPMAKRAQKILDQVAIEQLRFEAQLRVAAGGNVQQEQANLTKQLQEIQAGTTQEGLQAEKAAIQAADDEARARKTKEDVLSEQAQLLTDRFGELTTELDKLLPKVQQLGVLIPAAPGQVAPREGGPANQALQPNQKIKAKPLFLPENERQKIQKELGLNQDQFNKFEAQYGQAGNRPISSSAFAYASQRPVPVAPPARREAAVVAAQRPLQVAPMANNPNGYRSMQGALQLYNPPLAPSNTTVQQTPAQQNPVNQQQIQMINAAFTPFVAAVNNLVRMPTQIEVSVNDVSVSVNHNGLEVFSKISDEVKRLVAVEILRNNKVVIDAIQNGGLQNLQMLNPIT